MDFKKERNFIVAYDNDIMLAKWNIVSGQFIGKSGKLVASCPRAFTYNNLPYYSDGANESIFLGSAIRVYRQWFFDDYYYNEQMGHRFEELLSLGLRPWNRSDLDSKTRLTKEIVKYCKEKCNGRYNETLVQQYLAQEKYHDFLADRPEWLKEVFFTGIKNLPLDYIKTFLNRAEHEHINAFWNANYNNSHEIYTIMMGYYQYCKDMYGEVKVSPNILSNYAHLKALYKDFTEQHYDEMLEKHNNKPSLYFQYGNYEARPILTREAFHEEGEAQHNCVERMYMEKVHRGETYVVTVRRIDAPEKSVITCEVSKRGTIVQYLAFGNRRPENEEQMDFKNAYAKHLVKNFQP